MPFVPTAANVADMLTKPYSGPKEFKAFRSLIMNEPNDFVLKSVAHRLLASATLV